MLARSERSEHEAGSFQNSVVRKGGFGVCCRYDDLPPETGSRLLLLVSHPGDLWHGQAEHVSTFRLRALRPAAREPGRRVFSFFGLMQQ
jgi:hypothetical protein